ncbi:MAG TPA: AMP-binding protein [Thermoanaerobaculia bacterium]|jgi:O-succinylbenzoic acid--CoA ligase|nr:AMP-binding protein [Thermoanaerobaculia bacterium]
MIDFFGPDSHLVLNPRLPDGERARLERLVPPLGAHIFIATSGSSGAVKLVALSKVAILASAAALNEYFQAGAQDVWGSVLPAFHVGGLAVFARAQLARGRVLAMPWDPQLFVSTDCTLVSVVPAQLHDLVRGGVRPRQTLRAVLVGGGVLDPQLAEAARALGWPLFTSYGMTECCSTIAVDGKVLPHLEARVEADGRLAFRGASLLTGYATEEGVVDPKIGGWFVSEDVGRVEGGALEVAGRRGEFLKIGGESVDLRRLDAILDAVRGDVDAALVAIADERLGHVIHLAVAGEPGAVVEAFNHRVLPFERIRAVHRVEAIPRSSLGKLLRAKLAEELK